MRIEIQQTKINGHGHRTLIVTHHSPNWFERIFLRALKTTVVYCGSGTRWYYYPNMEPINWKRLEKELQEWEAKAKRQRL